jgi:hypothetical protein
MEHEVEQALLRWEPRINVLRVTVAPDQSDDSGVPDMLREYQRLADLESRTRLRALPHGEREERRRRALRAGAIAAGPGETTLPPHEIEAAMLRQIAAELPSFDAWQRERAAATAGPVLLITVDYVVKVTNSRFNVVYPFYLERGLGLNA